MSLDPISLLILAGGGLQAAGQIQEGRIAKAQGSFAKKMALRNQESLNRQAKSEMEAAKLEESRIARREKIAKSRQRAIVGKQGTGLAGAALAALIDTAAQFSMERNLALRRGFLRRRQLKERGRIIAAQGRWAKTMGNQAMRLSYVKAGASILGSVAMAKYYGGGTELATSGSAGGFGTTPAFTTTQRYSTFSGGGTVIPR